MQALKLTSLIIIQCFLLSSLLSQTYLDKKGNAQLWGLTTLNQLETQPFQEWYQKGYDDYSSSLDLNDGKILKDYKVKVFIGTWCGDTKFLLPRFIKAWDQMGLSKDQLEIIALHHEGENYKLGPAGEKAITSTESRHSFLKAKAKKLVVLLKELYLI